MGSGGRESTPVSDVVPSLATFLLRAALERDLAASIPGLGRVTVSADDREARPEETRSLAERCEGIGLSWAGAGGVLWIERALARVAVDALLERKGQVRWHPLSRIERGLLHGIVAGVASLFGVPPAVALLGEARPQLEAAILLRLRLDVAGNCARIWLAMSRPFAERALSEYAVPTALTVELASTTLARSEMRTAAVGDTVLFNDVPPLDPRGGWPVRLVAGMRAKHAELRTDGVLADVQSPPCDGTSTAVDRSLVTPAEHLENAIEIVAAIAQLDAACVQRLIARPVLPRSANVTLTAAGSPWARGAWTAVDGCFAVRLTKLLVS